MPNIDENFKGSALYGNELILAGEHFTADDLKGAGGGSIDVLNYHKVVTYINTSSPVIQDYYPGSRIYQVYRNGVYLSPNRDYTISSTGAVNCTTYTGTANYDIVIWSATTSIPVTPEDQTLGIGIFLDSSNRVNIVASEMGASIYYTIDGSEPSSSSTPYTGPFSLPVDGGNVVNAIAILGNKSSAIRSLVYNPNLSVGQTVTFEDGVPGTVVYDAGSEQSWGRFLIVDNQGLGYYINGETDTSSDVQKFAFGAYSYGSTDSNNYYIYQGIAGTDEAPSTTNIGDGRNATNAYCARGNYWGGVDTSKEGKSLFDSINTVRKQRKNSEWFLPVNVEADYIYNNRTSVPGLSYSSSGSNSYYYTSNEIDYDNSYIENMYNSNATSVAKYNSSYRARLMRTLSLATTKCAAPVITRNKETQKVEMICVDGAQIYYTLDGSNPISGDVVSGNLYTEPIQPGNNCEIRAQAISNLAASEPAYMYYKRYDIGDIVTKDDVPSVCIYAADNPTGQGSDYIFADRDHDLSYYINQTENGYVQWGGYGTLQGVDELEHREIGKGKSNSDLVIANLGTTSNTAWNWLSTFRSAHSNDWFIPSLLELQSLYTNSILLNNVTYSTYYWSSSELYSNLSWYVYFGNGYYNIINKNDTLCVRACWAL